MSSLFGCTKKRQEIASVILFYDEEYVELVAEDGNRIDIDLKSMSQRVRHSESIIGEAHKVCRCADLANSTAVVPNAA